MTSCNHMCHHSCNDSQEPLFCKTMLGLTWQRCPHCYFPSLTYPIPRCFSNRAYLGSFGTARWVSHELNELEELIAIRRDWQFPCETEVHFQNGWILTDSHASVQHLPTWTSIEDQSSRWP
ncbi:hypothetical protein TNCV_2737711 [Trichonephila clavipes]|nr:hypothetical protein TNCV_2737711 [Trichonephila clavipes]